jgi:NADH dehydrogenase/NADH:ubiquinone oxidoreductase subunit G
MVTFATGQSIPLCGADLSKATKHKCAKMECSPLIADPGWSCYRCDADYTKVMWEQSPEKAKENLESDWEYLKKDLATVDAAIQKAEGDAGAKGNLQNLKQEREKLQKQIDAKKLYREELKKMEAEARKQPEHADKEALAAQLDKVKGELAEAQKNYRAKRKERWLAILSPSQTQANLKTELQALRKKKDDLKKEKARLSLSLLSGCTAGFYQPTSKLVLQDHRTKNAAYFSNAALPPATATAKSALVRRQVGDILVLGILIILGVLFSAFLLIGAIGYGIYRLIKHFVK